MRDYDAKKAHEYYMKHRKLKGKRKTKNQKEQKAYIDARYSEQVNDENAALKSNLKKISSNYKKSTKSLSKEQQQKVKTLTDSCRQRIDEINARLQGLSPEMKQSIGPILQNMIDEIKNRYSILSQSMSVQATGEYKALQQHAVQAQQEMQTQHISNIKKLQKKKAKAYRKAGIKSWGNTIT